MKTMVEIFYYPFLIPIAPPILMGIPLAILTLLEWYKIYFETTNEEIKRVY